LEAVAPHLTRLDIACDILTETRPLDFVTKRNPGRFKSHSEVFSESGETCYVGSKQSNRYARVYRYNAPHERAHLLRVEYVIRAEDAVLTANALLQSGQDAVAKSLGRQYGWYHEDWNVEDTSDARLVAYRPDRREGKTLYWLNDTIAPLLVRLAREGIIDPDLWFYENVTQVIRKGDIL
jgi:Uri superfamily endonuclease